MFKYLVFCVILWVEIQPTILADNQSSDKPRTNKMVIHLQNVKWVVARKMCQEEGGDLAVIRSNAEENSILKTMSKYSIDKAWLGVKWSEGNWVTVSGELLNSTGWTRWDVEIPRPSQCAYLSGFGRGMSSQDCRGLVDGEGLNFVCSVPISE